MTTDPTAHDVAAHQDDAAPQSAAAWIPAKEARLRVGPVGTDAVQLAVAAGYEVVTTAVADVVAAGQGRRFVSMVTPPASFDAPVSSTADLLRAVPRALGGTAALAARNRVRRVRSKAVFGTTLMDEVCRIVYQGFLPDALARGRYVAAPPPLRGGRR